MDALIISAKECGVQAEPKKMPRRAPLEFTLSRAGLTFTLQENTLRCELQPTFVEEIAMRQPLCCSILFGLILSSSATAADTTQIGVLLKQPILSAGDPQAEVEAFCEARVPRMDKFNSLADWRQEAAALRRRVLDDVVFRGPAANWRDAKGGVVWLETIEGGPGYKIRKLRFEALPGLWIPALLYMPDELNGKAPAVMNVNGHDRNDGKAAKYKQIRCINQAKRGMIALNVEWLGMGQLNTPGFSHYRMNQLNLCGAAGIAPFYLAMSRGLDILLSLEETDPERVAVAGLSGGGWQTIFISSLDTRVKLCNPVAGYSSFITRIHHHSDLGDSEQTPCDLATVVDYTHLTAMLAPRAALLTHNLNDNCCFASPHALPPLLEAARPIYALYKAPNNLAFHVNENPGTHNFLIDNRQALYGMFKQHFFAHDPAIDAIEIPSDGELKTKQQLHVALPENNHSFQSLAEQLSRSLPHHPELPASAKAASDWQASRRGQLRKIVHAPNYRCIPTQVKQSRQDGVAVTTWRLAMQREGAQKNAAQKPEWTVPVIEFTPSQPGGVSQNKGVVILLADAGRASLADSVSAAVASGKRVFAVDPFYFGESKIPSRDFLFALLVSAVGERPLGIQAAQVSSIADWISKRHPGEATTIAAFGPRTSVIALAAAALSEKTIAGVEVNDSLGSLQEVIERELDVQKSPELMCFGLLQDFDLLQIAALVAPRPVKFNQPSARVKTEMQPLVSFYQTLGGEFTGW